MKQILDQFKYEMESLYYFYLNSLANSRSCHKRNKDNLRRILQKNHKRPDIQSLVINNLFIATKNNNKLMREDILQTFPYLKSIEHSIVDGRNENILGSAIVIESYHLWDEKFRSLLAKKAKVEKDKIKNDFWSEAKHYRHSIVHNKKRAISELEQCCILPKVPKDTPLKFTNDFIVSYMKLCTNSINDLKTEYVS